MVLPGSSIGRYLVKRKLAEGGMAELYLASAIGPEGFEKEVVIKRIKAFLSGDPSFIEMFKAEARLASRLNHANVVQIFDFDKHEDAWFIAMEYVYGASLWELRRRSRELAVPLPPVLVAEIGAQVARGLSYAHTLTEKGKPLLLVHRDVTPHNVLMSFDGGVKLTDFGIAKAGTSFTAPGMLKGKFAYMSPEQARGEKVDARADVFALGITLWEMLTGGRLFEGDSEMAVLRAVQESLIAPPSRLNPDVPADLSDLVMKALARPLEQRFQTAHELDRALAGFVLKNSSSPEDSNVGLFLRQMFRNELEEAARAMNSPPPTSDPGEPSHTPVVDAYALGNTKQVNRHHDPPTQQTATPLPSAPPPIGPAPQKTTEMPGQRRSRALPPLPEDGRPLQRTEQMNEVGAGPKHVTAQQPGLRPSRKLVALPELAPALAVPETATTEPRGMEATVPGRAPVVPVAALSAEPTKGSSVRWIVPAAGVVGVLSALAFMVDGRSVRAPPPPTVVEVPVVEAPPPPVAPVAPIVLEAAVAPTADALPAPVAVDSKPQPEPGSATKPVAAVAKGTLTIDAQPYGLVSIDNARASEVSGVKHFSLSPGTHSVRISHARLEVNETVVIKSGKTQALTFRPLAAPPPR